MKRQNPTLRTAIADWAGEAATVREAARANSISLAWDERIAPARENALAREIDGVTGAGPALWASLCEGYARYLKTRLKWDGSDSVPEPFTADNADAALGAPPAEWRQLVRVVRIDTPLARAHGITLDRLAAAVRRLRDAPGSSGAKAEAQATVERFVQVFNEYNPRPPYFAGLLRDVATEADQDDWPTALRDRFGLGKLNAWTEPVPVMQLRYKVEAVFDRLPPGIDGASAFRVPTALDSNLYEYFFPAPSEQYYGRTIDLNGTLAGRGLTCEIIHFPVDIAAGDIWDVGMIDSPIPAGAGLTALRNGHLQRLRDEFGRPDFAEMM